MNVVNEKRPESVEISLEDFIAQADACSSESWALHTADVELIDESELRLDAELDPELDEIADVLEPTVSSEHRRSDYTEVVSVPLPAPWTTNPLVIIGGLLAAFIVGAGVVFVMVRAMMPAQPVMQQPQPVAVAQPVVTALPRTVAPQQAEAPAPSVAAVIEPAPPSREHVSAAPKHHAAATPKKAAAVASRKPAQKSLQEKSRGGDWVDPFAQ